MNIYARLGIVAALLAVIGITLAMKQKDNSASGTGTIASAQDSDGANVMTADPPGSDSGPSTDDSASAATTAEATGPGAQEVASAKKALPRLVDLGAGKCIPCKQMAPILENLKKEYAGRMKVEFIDVWENPRAGDLYGVRMIPTQIFYDASGKERFRHEGFYSKEDILGKWKELGVDVEIKRASN